MSQLLLEIFSEEIPARMQQGAARDLERMATDRLKAAGLTWDALTTYAGPRRLTLVIDGLPAATPDRNEELKGPKISAPAQALEGFLRKTGLTQNQLVERDGVWFAEISSKGRATTEVVAESVDDIIRHFPWPKSMRWGTGTLRWVRPIKRILALFDGAVIPFEVDGIPSGDVTEGHRFMGAGQPFAVKDFADYRQKLERNFVLLDAADRKLRILEGAKAVCATKGLALVDDDGLLDEVSGLAEWPTPILGDMDPQFLALPPEVVQLSMKVHQKYFAVREPGKEGLAPHFVVVANVEATDGGQALAAGNAKVLSARLSDAEFFWTEDQKVGFDAWNAKLKDVTFHAKLGTLAERVDRIAALAREIAPLVGADPAQAEQAARLSKADLASGMVGEFPELQGIMGGYYARLAGQPDAVADAIRDHYKPQGPGDTVPTAPVTVAVAMAEKLDTLVGFFAIDEKPTGSKDPYALRRAALGVIRLVLENGVRASLTKLTHPAVVMIVSGRNLSMDKANSTSLLAFFADRLTVLLRDKGQRHDLVAAVFALGDDDLVRIVRRVEALAAFLATDDGANLLAGYKRAAQLLKAEEKKGSLPEGAVATGLPNQPAEETALAFAAAAAASAVDAALEAEDFAAAMTALAALRGPVDAFFTAVMVNSDVAEERENRLKLLVQVRGVMNRVADFGQIAG
ncbi:glycine--tRNA ligase subunit beta [Brevundimonas diminuta]|jgi:glycyl-tRNA synthetase beta chain|uniref:Glycine--tRNA ligase beta subunit n=2 Tax=Brevundimonas diminuta TaxID=293 RepID=A0A410P1B7_BREDI|nr:glycine--tRNA ligase subunit beta [Brevundimonas diminuta]MBD3574182.1 glycine--tRNA ligase subunit beta [Brevundimonas diminuta]QAT15887.1 glycine--tRNA ligase subunit beta [Brevundimonas diminuta]QQB89895.1 glycine--tRNA ligase subunit beta [Brevundimonas diminuta]GEB99667.1 glycine--tRNA ligase beta subunit [Brevundimonas diminuta]